MCRAIYFAASRARLFIYFRLRVCFDYFSRRLSLFDVVPFHRLSEPRFRLIYFSVDICFFAICHATSASHYYYLLLSRRDCRCMRKIPRERAHDAA